MADNKFDSSPRRSKYNNIDGFVRSTRMRPRPQSNNVKLPKPSQNSTSQRLKARASVQKKRKKFSKKKIAFLIASAVLLISIVAGVWDAWQLNHKVQRLTVGDLTSSIGGAENILVAGSTNRCGLKVQNAQWGFCSQGVTGVNSDIIFIVHLVPSTNTATILSIPRDTFVPNARSGNQAFKIDAALYQGPTQLVKAIQQDFGIPIQHYAEVQFDGFVNIVNAIGGIKMNFPMPVYDSESYLNIKSPGCKLLNGVEALQVVRARHLQYKPANITTTNVHYWPQENQSDIARIARTHEFLKVLASTVSSKGLKDPITDQKLVNAIAPQVQVDSGFSTSTMLALLNEFHAININNLAQFTLPVTSTSFGSYEYNGNNYGDVVFPVEPNDQQVINTFLGVSNTTNTMTGQALPKAQSVSVNVINGSNVPGQAAKASISLQSLGFKVVGHPASAIPVSYQEQETVVYYANDSNEAAAQAVAHQLSGYVILSRNTSKVTLGSDVTVVSGTGAAVNTPTPSSTAASTTAKSTQPTTTSSASSSSNLGTASSAQEPLAPWDPRSCTN